MNEEEDKKKYASLQPLIASLSHEVYDWPEIEKHNHIYGGEEFRLFNRSIGHIHANGLLDLPFVKELRQVLLEEKWAVLHHVHSTTTWVSKQIQTEKDIEHAKSLLLLSYWIKGCDYFDKSENSREFIIKNLGACKFSPSIFAAAKFQTGGSICPNK